MEKDHKQCPYCGEEILAVAKKCKHCGEWLEESTGDTATNQTVKQGGKTSIPNTEIVSTNNNSSGKTLVSNPTSSASSNKKKWIIALSVVVILIVTVSIILGTSSTKEGNVISEEPIEEYAVMDDPSNQSQPDEIDFSDNWEVKYFKDSFGEDDKSDPYIQKEFSTDSDPIKILFSKSGFAIFGEYFPSLVEELTIKDENGNLTMAPCLENAPNNTLMVADPDCYRTLVGLLDSGKDFTLRLKVWDFGNESHYKAYKVSGWSGQGVTKAIQKHIIG